MTSEIASQQQSGHQPYQDPWNWKMPGRESLMSLSSINSTQDQVRVKTANGLRTKRLETANLSTVDIKGKSHERIRHPILSESSSAGSAWKICLVYPDLDPSAFIPAAFT